MGIYLLTQAVVMMIYVKSKLVPAWALGLLVGIGRRCGEWEDGREGEREEKGVGWNGGKERGWWAGRV